ncbi:MAG: hypothetical protein JO348_08350 [Alphaproteobacteria bacterium]|nr:hypothetical protein [Alphaproteobacteria bacterium]
MLTPAQREVFFLFKPAPRPPKLPLKIEPQAPSKLATPLFQYRPPIVEGPSTEITAPPQRRPSASHSFAVARRISAT